jgi:glycosyltransferase involved in cell wall biosynthesis
MKNIVFDCERMKYPDTGIYHYCLNLGSSLQNKLADSNFQLNFFSPPNSRPIFDNGQNIVPQHSLQKWWMPDTRLYQLWHATYQNTAYLPRRNRRIKVVLTVHDLNFLYDERKSDFKKEKHLRHLQHNINRADAIVCISDYCRNDVLKHGNTKGKAVHVIYNGTNALSQASLNLYSYQPQRPFLFSVGVLSRKKNWHALLPLLQQNQELEWLIAGRWDDPEYKEYLFEMASQLQVEHQLRLLGSVSEGEKSWYYRNCRAFVAPSLAEGFCMPVTEAMSIGKPLFLSNRTALPEIGGNTAFYFPDFHPDLLQRVYHEGMHRYTLDGMKEKIVERSNSFCWKKSAEQYISVYQSLLD